MKIHLLTLCAVTALAAGCSSTRPLRPGTASIKSGAQFVSELKQPENPAQSAAQNFERITETELPLPAGTKLQETIVTRNEGKPEAPPVVTEKTIVLAAPTIQKTRTVEKAGTTIGAAQKDTARELGAKLSSLKGIVWLGAALFLFGLASIFYPPLKLIIGSVTTSLAIAAGGLTLIILPTLIVGHELLILGAVAICVALWFLAHRHGRLRGLLDASPTSVPAPTEVRSAK